MKELTLSQILDEAFERSRDLDAPLSVRLESIANSVRIATRFLPKWRTGLSRGSISMAPAPRLPLSGIRCHRSCCPTIKGISSPPAKGPVALSFHRGHWCPYCRLNTNALAQAQRDVEPIGGQIVAITPDLQHFATALKSEAAAKPFPILTDVDNGYALSLNLAIFVGLEMQKFMKSAGWNIAPYQGNDAWILPIPATFIVGPDSIIRAQFVDPDYRKRMAIDVIVDALRAC